MNVHFYKAAKLDLRATIVTGLFAVLLVYLTVFTDGALWMRLSLSLGLFFVTGIFAVRGYAIDDDTISVIHYFWRRRFPLADLEEATLDPGATVGSIRTFAIGGVFGYIGRYRNRQLGRYLAYVTDGSHAVVLRFQKKIVVISPEDQVGFLEELLATGRIA